MSEFSYGMLCEGDSDLYTLEIVCKRIAENHGYKIILIEDVSQPVSGPITKINTKIKTKQFINKGVTFAVYFADYDKGKTDKYSTITEGIKAVEESYIEVSAIGVPIPHMEEWLINDENLIKRYLQLPSSKPLPHPKELPKHRLEQLVSQHGPVELTTGEFRKIIASEMKLEIVAQRSPSFARFQKNLVNVLATVARNS